jgi:hypothetical protein
MTHFASTLRNWLVPVGFGAVAPTVLVGVYGVLVATIWLPASRYLWTAYQIQLHDLPVNATWLFDAAIGLLLGIVISFSLARIVKVHYLRAFGLFALSFVAAAVAPSAIAGEFDLGGFILLQPLVQFFAAASIAFFSLKARFEWQHNVP